jgi:hypothetical protein
VENILKTLHNFGMKLCNSFFTTLPLCTPANAIRIGELSYLHEASEAAMVGGAKPVAVTRTFATATPNYVDAGAAAGARGNEIKVTTQTQVINEPYFKYASGYASASAKSGDQTAESTSLSIAKSTKNSSSSHTIEFSFNP